MPAALYAATSGTLRFQGFCSLHTPHLAFLGRAYGRYRVAANAQGLKLLGSAGFTATLTTETEKGTLVYLVHRKAQKP